MALDTKLASLLEAVNHLMGVIDGKLRNKANKAEVHSKSYLENSANTLGANAATASKLRDARTITVAGDGEATGQFDGSENLTLTLAVPALASKAEKSETLTPEQIDQRIQTLIGSAPETLDTLAELAEALNNDPDFAGTIAEQLGNKVKKTQLEDYFAQLTDAFNQGADAISAATTQE